MFTINNPRLSIENLIEKNAKEAIGCENCKMLKLENMKLREKLEFVEKILREALSKIEE